VAKVYAEKFYHSPIWKATRDSYIESVHGLCQICLSKGKITTGYIVHHLIELTPENINNPEVSLNQDNLQYVCLNCHNTIHFGESEVIREDMEFDEHGDVVSR